MTDIIIDDGFVDEMESLMGSQGERFEYFLKEYIDIIIRVSYEGVKGGKTKESLLQYAGLAQQLKGSVGRVSEMGKSILKKYMEEIDMADKFLY